MINIKENVKNNIKKYRKQMGLNQTQLGELVGKKKTTVASWEQGDASPDIETLYYLSKIFNVEIEKMYE